MQLEQTLHGRAVRLIGVSGLLSQTIHGGRLARACEARYGFLQNPRTVEEFSLDKGIAFYHGYFDGGVIERLQLFKDGFVAEAKADTDFCDRFLDDSIQWLKQEVGVVTSKEDGSPRFYYSTLEVKGSFSLGEAIEKLSPLGDHLLQMLKSYGQATANRYQLVGLGFSHTVGTEPTWRFERRAGIMDEWARLYHSTAPLRTEDHMTLLNRLEEAFLS
jgi:hypothetical protein